MQGVVQAWQREFTGSLAEATATARWLDQLAAEQGLPESVLFALQLCSEELLTNIIKHGGKESPRVVVALSRHDDRVELRIEDDGRPFDVARSEPHRVEGPLDAVEPGGLGIHLVHSFADEVRYERGALGNAVTVSINLAGKNDKKPA